MDSHRLKSVLDLFKVIPDCRQPSGRRYPLWGLLSVVLGALLSGRTSFAAIARWGRSLSAKTKSELGFPRKKAPCAATYFNVFKSLDIKSFEKELRLFLTDHATFHDESHLAIDGKTLRGSKHGENPGLHILSAYASQLGGVLAQVATEAKQNELSVVGDLLKDLSLTNRVVTGDAMFAQKSICRDITEKKGDYLFVVKGNQEGLQEQIALVFNQDFSPEFSWDPWREFQRRERARKNRNKENTSRKR